MAEDPWVQFDCPDCILIEYAYHQYTASKMKEEFRFIKMREGTIDLKEMLIEWKKKDDQEHANPASKIQRSAENKR